MAKEKIESVAKDASKAQEFLLSALRLTDANVIFSFSDRKTIEGIIERLKDREQLLDSLSNDLDD